MIDQIMFENKDSFRKWLLKNHNVSKGIWLILVKQVN